VGGFVTLVTLVTLVRTTDNMLPNCMMLSSDMVTPGEDYRQHVPIKSSARNITA
jgi:hypothetical protein